jgi:triosephosphate isomerase
MRRKLVVGNWKMHGSRASISELMVGLRADWQVNADVAVCPPFPYLSLVADALGGSDIVLGGQNAALADSGAHTGEVSADMLADLGCGYVIVGHSERRSLYGDSDQVVAAKVGRVLAANMVPILCVGESLPQRERGDTLDVVGGQLHAVWDSLDKDGRQKLVLAYEPVWAIGTGKTASPAQAQEVHGYLREQLTIVDAADAAECRILYGGSVKADNAAELFAQSDIDGALVGGASLQAAEFLNIVKAAG